MYIKNIGTAGRLFIRERSDNNRSLDKTTNKKRFLFIEKQKIHAFLARHLREHLKNNCSF
jgi:hypothetical protein